MTMRKHLLCASLALIGLGAGYVAAQPASTLPVQPADATLNAPAVKYRKNIDALSPQELAAFKHAVKRMKEKSQANIYDRTGFLWQAWVHNCPAVEVLDTRQAPLPGDGLEKLLANVSMDSCQLRNFVAMPGSAKTHTEKPGQCEHRKNTFLQWHRAELYFYEKALQAADPEGAYGPGTQDVTLPYWNFTQKPSGKRYPQAFEDPTSPLFDATHYQDALPSSLPTASPYLLAYLIYYLDWPTFGGGALDSGGGRYLETKIHNLMHNDYIGGKMQDNTQAAMDPIFYVFHNFLDYSLEKWLEVHGADAITGTGRTDYMRGEQDDTLPKPLGFDEGSSDPKRSESGNYTSNMGRAEIYFDTQKQGFGFLPQAEEFIPRDRIQALIDKHQQAGFVFGDNPISLFSALLDGAVSGPVANPTVKLRGKYRIPDQPIGTSATARLTFNRNAVTADYSFQAEVYLYPEGTPEDVGQAEFRNRYLVTNTAHWGLSRHHPEAQIVIAEDITGIINSLVPKKHGEDWKITVAISGNNPSSIDVNHFTAPFIAVQAK